MEAAQTEHIGIVMFSGEACGFGVDAQGRANAGKFIGCDAHADAGFADNNALICPSLRDVGGNGSCVIRIVC